jgi:hypothetical protein
MEIETQEEHAVDDRKILNNKADLKVNTGMAQSVL